VSIYPLPSSDDDAQFLKNLGFDIPEGTPSITLLCQRQLAETHARYNQQIPNKLREKMQEDINDLSVYNRSVESY